MISTKYKATLTLAFQPKYPTYTPETFKRTMDKKGFLLSQGQARTPMGQSIPLEAFSKGDIIVIQLQNPAVQGAVPQVVFQILNNFSLKIAYDETVKELLSELKLVDSAVAGIDIRILVYVPALQDSLKSLSSILKSGMLSKLNKKFLKKNLSVTSLRLGSAFPMGQEGLEIIIEPSASNPNAEFFINLHMNTSSLETFMEFINIYEKDLIINMIGTLLGDDINAIH
ncbi:MAG: hypothetical protein ACYCSO_07045 [Cuniculiplasma sp.]